jgi:hypothetical protein
VICYFPHSKDGGFEVNVVRACIRIGLFEEKRCSGNSSPQRIEKYTKINFWSSHFKQLKQLEHPNVTI